MMDSEAEKRMGCPKSVPSHLWEKFKVLEKRTHEATQRSTEKRIKHLQRQVMETVTQEFTSSTDKDILREHDVKFGPPVEVSRGKKRKAVEDNRFTKEKPSEPDSAKQLQDLMNVNQHLHLTDHSRPPPPTALEKKIDAAISSGDFGQAETLSDHLAEREVGEKIVAAIDAKKYLEEKEKEEESERAKKKKKLAWGFEPKNRWETKGNM